MSQQSDVRILVRACNAPPEALTKAQVTMAAIILSIRDLPAALELVATFKRAQVAHKGDGSWQY